MPGPRDSRETDLWWGGLIIPAGSQVRMRYCGGYHHASVAYRNIFDDGRTYSPAEWARKTANHTSRNAWRDLEFCLPGSFRWVLADDLRAMSNEAFDRECEALQRK